jgi:hypothetical protein
MNMARPIFAATCLALLMLSAAPLLADDVRYYDENGITYRETVQTTQRAVPQTTMQPQDKIQYRQRYTTELQDAQRTYQVPITENVWKPEIHRSWNPFEKPYVAYRLVQQTRYETRSEIVKVPVAKSEVVPEKITTQVPVTTHRIANEEVRTRVAVGHSGTGTAVAGTTNSGSIATMASSGGTSVGGVSQMGDGLPKQSPGWTDADATSRR